MTRRKTKGTILVSAGEGPLSNWENVGDEPYMLSIKLKKIPIVVDENRYRGGIFLIKNYNPDVIIMDDGFQHRSLKRDLDIVLINGKDNINDYKIFPYGVLREPWDNVKRADTIFITKNTPDNCLLNKIKKTKLSFFDTKLKSFISPLNKSTRQSNQSFKKKKVVLLSGIADPDSFKNIINDYGFIEVGSKIFPDHYPYNKKNILKVIKYSEQLNADYIITTEKDWVKIEKLKPKFPFVVIGIQIEVVEKGSLEKLIQSVI